MDIERKAGFARLTGPRGPVFSHMYYKKYFYGFLQKNFAISGSEDFWKSTESWIEKIHFCEVQKIFDFPKMKKSQKLQKKWQNKTSDGYRLIISGSLLFGLRPNSPSDPQLYYKKYDMVRFRLIFSGIIADLGGFLGGFTTKNILQYLDSGYF